jgi:hypothetical protein
MRLRCLSTQSGRRQTAKPYRRRSLGQAADGKNCSAIFWLSIHRGKTTSTSGLSCRMLPTAARGEPAQPRGHRSHPSGRRPMGCEECKRPANTSLTDSAINASCAPLAGAQQCGSSASIGLSRCAGTRSSTSLVQMYESCLLSLANWIALAIANQRRQHDAYRARQQIVSAQPTFREPSGPGADLGERRPDTSNLPTRRESAPITGVVAKELAVLLVVLPLPIISCLLPLFLFAVVLLLLKVAH